MIVTVNGKKVYLDKTQTRVGHAIDKAGWENIRFVEIRVNGGVARRSDQIEDGARNTVRTVKVQNDKSIDKKRRKRK